MLRRVARQTEPGKLPGWSVTEIGAKAVRRQSGLTGRPCRKIYDNNNGPEICLGALPIKNIS